MTDSVDLKKMLTALELELHKAWLQRKLSDGFDYELYSPDRFGKIVARLSLSQIFTAEVQKLMKQAIMPFGVKFSLNESEVEGQTLMKDLALTAGFWNYVLPPLIWDPSVDPKSFDATLELYLSSMEKLLQHETKADCISIFSSDGSRSIGRLKWSPAEGWAYPLNSAENAGATIRAILMSDHQNFVKDSLKRKRS